MDIYQQRQQDYSLVKNRLTIPTAEEVKQAAYEYCLNVCFRHETEDFFRLVEKQFVDYNPYEEEHEKCFPRRLTFSYCPSRLQDNKTEHCVSNLQFALFVDALKNEFTKKGYEVSTKLLEGDSYCGYRGFEMSINW